MSAPPARLHHLADLLVGGSGIVLLVTKYLLVNDDPFSVVNHPLQPHARDLHLLTAPLLVFTTALLWERHIVPGWRSGAGSRLRSGVASTLAFVPMVVSGGLLQVTVSPGWRTLWTWVHVGTGVLWLLAAAFHLVGRRPRPGRPT